MKHSAIALICSAVLAWPCAALAAGGGGGGGGGGAQGPAFDAYGKAPKINPRRRGARGYLGEAYLQTGDRARGMPVAGVSQTATKVSGLPVCA